MLMARDAARGGRSRRGLLGGVTDGQGGYPAMFERGFGSKRLRKI
jgi:hypothetical protein